MNIDKLLDIVDYSNAVDTDKASSRRDYFSFSLDIIKKIAVAAVPATLLGILPTKSFARTNDIPGVLNFALTLEYLEQEFYILGISSGVIPSADRTIFQQISKHETAHVTFLTNTINSLGVTPVRKPTFDFTAKGAFNPFVVYADFLALSQAFEDTGVRAYKGQAGNLMGNKTILTAALQIHSVEARHASEVRRLRKKNGLDTNNKAWISGNSRGTLPAATQAVYDGDDNVTQAGLNATLITSVDATAVQQAFDEALTDVQVNAIASLFIVA
jgi:Ferritin-like domain